MKEPGISKYLINKKNQRRFIDCKLNSEHTNKIYLWDQSLVKANATGLDQSLTSQTKMAGIGLFPS